MEKDKLAHVKLLLSATQNIKDFIRTSTGSAMEFSDFENDRKTQSSVIMQLQVIGELVKKIPDNLKSDVNLPWKQMIGLRDMISHDYFSLDLEEVWNTATKDVLELEREISGYLKNQK